MNKCGKYQINGEDEDEKTTTCSPIFLPTSKKPHAEIAETEQSENVTTISSKREDQSRAKNVISGHQYCNGACPDKDDKTKAVFDLKRLQVELKEYKEKVKGHDDKKQTLLSSGTHPTKDDTTDTAFNLKSLQVELEEYKGKVKGLEDEKQTLLSRLSESMGRQLEEGNPQITNLNDPNRPQKIGEMFVSVYDNEWSDAFSFLDNSGLGLRDITDILLGILKLTYEGCKIHIHKVFSLFKERFPCDGGSLDNQLLKFVSSIPQTMISYLGNEMEKDVTSKYNEQITDKCGAYIGQCVQLCFFMLTKSPPMFLYFECTEHVDKQTFKVFTKNGDKFDYLVWPVLFLYKGGPIIEKGIVQCK